MDEKTVEAVHVAQEKVQRSMKDIQPALDSFRRLSASYDFTKLSRDLFASYAFTKLSRDLFASYDFTKLSRNLFASYDFTKLSRNLFASYDFTKLVASYGFAAAIREAAPSNRVLAEAIHQIQDSPLRGQVFDWVDLPEGPTPANHSPHSSILESLLRVALDDLAELARRVDAPNWRDVIAILALFIALIQLATSSDCSQSQLLP